MYKTRLTTFFAKCQVCRNTLLCSIPKDFIELSVVEVEGGGGEGERERKQMQREGI